MIGAALGKILLSELAAVSCGLLAVLVGIALRWHRYRRWPSLHSISIAFLGGALVPYALVLLIYSFFATPPDLASARIYFPLAGLALIWAAIITVRQSIDNDVPDQIRGGPDPPVLSASDTEPPGGSDPNATGQQ